MFEDFWVGICKQILTIRFRSLNTKEKYMFASLCTYGATSQSANLDNRKCPKMQTRRVGQAGLAPRKKALTGRMPLSRKASHGAPGNPWRKRAVFESCNAESQEAYSCILIHLNMQNLWLDDPLIV